MAGVQINRIVNANVYLNGNSMLGKVDECKLPDIKIIETEQKTLGMVGKIELPAGFDKLEGELKWNSFYADVWQAFANPWGFNTLMLRSSVDTYNSQGRVSQVPLVTTLTVASQVLPMGTYKQQDNAEFQGNFTATYIKQTMDGKDILELDILANVFKVNGIDQLALYRVNIGA